MNCSKTILKNNLALLVARFGCFLDYKITTEFGGGGGGGSKNLSSRL